MNLSEIIDHCGPRFEERAPELDRTATFARENFEELLRLGAYKAMIPEELGGGGASFTEMCHFVKDLARFCPSTALTHSMHQHLIAVQVFKYHQDKSSEPLLRMVVEKDLVLLSTGGGDWLSSNGSSKKVDGGYEISCRKSFCSGSEMADIAVMSCAYNDGEQEWVLHFGAPMNAEGVTILDDWDAMGMRATGSNSVMFSNVFIPDEKIVLKRVRGEWHAIWSAVSTYAHPIFMAPYVGVAEAIAEKTIGHFRNRPNQESSSLSALGGMHASLHVAKLAWQDMVTNARDFETMPTVETANRALMGKSLITRHGRESAQLAMEALGGYSYFTKVGIERLYRDLLAGEFHPLQGCKQQVAMGRFLVDAPSD